jgi:biotin transport system ATP-binding protein
MIELDDVAYTVDGASILDALTLTADQRRIGVIGANGSGKSSFVRLLNGLILPTRGRVVVDGLDVRAQLKAVRRRVGFVFQNPDHQIVMPLVEEDVAFGLHNRGVPVTRARNVVTAVLERFGLAHLRDRPCHSLSGGEKQMLALAGAVVTEPSLMVFDEPTALLDLRNRNRIREAIALLTQHVVLVTHDLELVEDFDRVLVFDRGRIVADDVPQVAVAMYRASMA